MTETLAPEQVATDIRSRILNAHDVQTELVDVPEWGVTVQVRGMTGKQRADFLLRCVDEDNKPKFDRIYPEILIACCFDPETGRPVFEPTDRDVLNTKSAKPTERIAKVAMALSGIDDDAKDAAKNG